MGYSKQFFTFMPTDIQDKNWFDLSHDNSGSCNMGPLYPVLCEPTLPGDYHSLEVSYLLRMAQMVAPPMTRIGVHFFAFDVPNRILMNSRYWDKFLADIDGSKGFSLPTLSFTPIYEYLKTFIPNLFSFSGYDDKEASNLQTYLSSLSADFGDLSLNIDDNFFTITGAELSNESKNAELGKLVLDFLNQYPLKGSLLDYLGMPVSSPLFSTSQFIIFDNDYAGDQAIFTKVDLISPQRSFQFLPMLAYLYIWNEYFRQEFIQEEIPEELLEDFNSWKQKLGSDISILWKLKRRDWEHDYYTSCLPSTQLGGASAISIGEDGQFTIPELREANVIQKIREKLFHGGTRIWEILQNFFQSSVSDSRIQIPEFIKPLNGTGHSWLKISDIYQTAPGSSDALPTLDASANIAAPRGASVNTNNLGLRIKHKSKEHGYLMVLMNIQPVPVYCQGIPRHFLQLDALDFGWPDYANITEQPVYEYEVYATAYNSKKGASGDYPIFGYQSQYSWYKFHNSELHGELRDDLDFFHFARIFDEQPYLNDTFLQCNPTDRPFPIQYEYDKLTYHLHFNYSVERCLSYYGIPSLR